MHGKFVKATFHLGTAHYLSRAWGLEIFAKNSLEKSLSHPKNMTKTSLPCTQLLQKKVCVSYVKEIHLLKIKTLSFQKEINSKKYTSLNEQPY